MDEELREFLSQISGQLESVREIMKGVYEELVFLRGDQDERAEQLRKPPWQFSKSQKICERRYV